MTTTIIEKIRKINSEKECLNLAKNAEDRGRTNVAEAARFRAAELRAEADSKAGRRPDIDYNFIGLKNGQKIVLSSIGEAAEIYSHRTLLYKGREIYITPLEEELLAAGHPRKSISGKWVVEETGKLLSELYEERYGKEK